MTETVRDVANRHLTVKLVVEGVCGVDGATIVA